MEGLPSEEGLPRSWHTSVSSIFRMFLASISINQVFHTPTFNTKLHLSYPVFTMTTRRSVFTLATRYSSFTSLTRRSAGSRLFLQRFPIRDKRRVVRVKIERRVSRVRTERRVSRVISFRPPGSRGEGNRRVGRVRSYCARKR